MGGREGTKVEDFEICMEHGGRPFEGGILKGKALEAGHGMWRCRIPVRQPWPIGVIRRLGARHLKLFQEGCLAWGWLLENRQDTLPARHLLDEVEYGAGVFAWEGLSSEEREEVDQLSDMVGEGGRTMGW